MASRTSRDAVARGTTPLASAAAVKRMVRAAYEGLEEQSPAEAIDSWLADHGVAVPPKAERSGADVQNPRHFTPPEERLAYRMEFKRLARAWWLYARRQNNGELPPTPNNHSNTVARLPIKCAHCDTVFTVLPSEKRAGRKYCGTGCSAAAQSPTRKAQRTSEAAELRRKRNELIMRLWAKGYSGTDIATKVDMTANSVYRLIRKMQAEGDNHA